MENNFDIAVIGGGIVGMSSAYKIQLRYPEAKIGVFEKEAELAAHQTGRNSGVIHSGLYYKSGSFKAKNCTQGRRELVEFAVEHGIEHDICGKVIVATQEAEHANLDRVFQNGLANGIEGLEKIDAGQITQLEPQCKGVAGIYVPCTGIIDFKCVVGKLAELVERGKSGSRILKSTKVMSIGKHDGVLKLVTNQGEFSAKYLVNCAGLQSDRIAKMEGTKPGMRIIPFRGDYYELTPSAISKVKNLIYPVPDPAFPFLGVHFTRMIDGTVECGPNAVFSFKREGYSKIDFSLKDTWDSLTYFGTWVLFMRNWRYGMNEYWRAFSKGKFLRELQRLIPTLTADDIKPSRAGVRAQALGPKGELVDDFKIARGENAVHVLNAPSPAATACLAIGQTVCDTVAEHFKL